MTGPYLDGDGVQGDDADVAAAVEGAAEGAGVAAADGAVVQRGRARRVHGAARVRRRAVRPPRPFTRFRSNLT